MTRSRLLLAALFGGLFLFSLYGVMSSAEPTGDAPLHTGWFAFYGLLGLSSLLGGARLCRPSKPLDDEEAEPNGDLADDADSLERGGSGSEEQEKD